MVFGGQVDGWEDGKVGRFEVEEYFHEFFFFACLGDL
jgi:hypothetical protein